MTKIIPLTEIIEISGIDGNTAILLTKEPMNMDTLIIGQSEDKEVWFKIQSAVPQHSALKNGYSIVILSYYPTLDKGQ